MMPVELVWDPASGTYITRSSDTPAARQMGGGETLSGPPPVGPNEAPASTSGLSQRHPRLARFLQNLAPALAAMQTSPRPPQGESPLNGVLRSLAGGAQSYLGAKENIRAADFKRSPTAQSAEQKLTQGRLDELSPGELYYLQTQGRAPQNFLSAGQAGQGQRIGAGIEVSPEGQAKLGLQGREVAVQEGRAATEATQVANQHEEAMRSLGLKDKDLQDQKRRTDLEARKLGISIGQSFVGADPKERQAAIKYGKWVAGFGPRPTDDEITIAESLPSIGEVEAHAKEAAAGIRENAFQKQIRSIMESEGARLTPEERINANRAVAVMLSPGFAQRWIEGDDVAKEAVTTFESIFPVTKQGGGFGAWISNFLGGIINPGAKGQAAEAAGAARPGSDAQSELDALKAAAAKAGGYTPAQKKRYDELIAAGAH